MALAVAEDSSEEIFFFLKNSSRRLAFLLRVDGLGFFLKFSFPLVSKGGNVVLREKEKLEPAVRVKLKVKPWLISVWQRSRHLEAKEDSLSPSAVIFVYF